MKLILLSTFGACAAMVLSGCDGGGGDGGSCGVVDACGGDVVGTWNITSACAPTTASALSPDCPTGSISVLSVQTSGTMEYGADLTFSTQATLSATERLTFPGECLGATTCAQLGATLQADPASSSAVCVASGTGCVCVVGIAPVSGAETGTYTTSAGVLTLTPTTRAPEQDNYCIEGTTMIVGSMMGVTTSGTLTLVRQP